MSDVRDAIESGGPSLWLSLADAESIYRPVLADLVEKDVAAAIWQREGDLWSEAPGAIDAIEERLGWLDLPDAMRIQVPRLKMLALEIEAARAENVVLLGMGGSSLAPEVMQRILGNSHGHPRLTVLDSTDPDQIRRVEALISPERTIFLVASKSGTTAETRNLLTYFYALTQESVGEEDAPRRFVAITDPGTQLAKLGQERGFRAVYRNPPDIGGRYSALSLFGLVPGATIGLDLDTLLDRAQVTAGRCAPGREAERNPGLVLGAALGALASAAEGKRDKLTILASPAISSFVDWVEQLIAESTGKRIERVGEQEREEDGEHAGILPLEDEGLDNLSRYGDDRLFVYLRLVDDDNEAMDDKAVTLAEAGHSLIVQRWQDRHDLGSAFFIWEFAVAVAGHVMGINPFNQPNVEAAKEQARAALRQYEQTRELPEQEPVVADGDLTIYGPDYEVETAADYLHRFLDQARPRDYVALMAYIDRCSVHDEALCDMRRMLAHHLGIATTRGFGPRFLHSTGQLHKGGPNTGLFVQIVREEMDDLEIPGRDYTFGILKEAQALGDLRALEDAGRRVMRVCIGKNVLDGLEALERALTEALR